jgi:hypothetical protein
MMEVFGSFPPTAAETDDVARPEASRARPLIAIQTIAHRMPRPALWRAMAWLLHQLHLDGQAGRAA